VLCPTPAELSKSAVVVIDLANDFLYAGGVIADAGGPAYQAKAQAVIPPLERLLAAARRAGHFAEPALDLDHEPEKGSS